MLLFGDLCETTPPMVNENTLLGNAGTSETDKGFHLPLESKSTQTRRQRSGENEGRNRRQRSGGKDKPRREKDSVERQAETLASFTVDTFTGKKNGHTECPVERTLLRCVKEMLKNNEIFFENMMKTLDLTRDTGYGCFLDAARQLFDEGERVTWTRIILLYTFAGRLAMYCQELGMEDFCCTITQFLRQSAREFVAPFVRRNGGWTKLCEEFPLIVDFERMAWQFLSWSAFYLGLVAVVSLLTRR